MRVIIAGSRTIKDHAVVYDAIEESKFYITEVVHGGAVGVDQCGFDWAIANGITIKCFHPDWNQYGKAAGPIRNSQMARYADALILVWDGKSRGSASMKREAEEKKILIYEKIISSSGIKN